jgi:hypothetical protein
MEVRCPKCHATSHPGATTCQWCGTPLPKPDPNSPAALVDREPDLPNEPHPPKNLEEEAIAGIAIVVVIIVLAAGFAWWVDQPAQAGPSFRVSQVLVYSSDDACGLNGANQAGFSIPKSGPPSLNWTLPLGGAPLPCTVHAVSTDTPGFSFLSDLPMTVHSGLAVLTVTVEAPASYYGPLNVTFS